MLKHKNCLRCGEEFQDKDGRKKYCSISCGAKKSNYDTAAVLGDLEILSVAEILTKHQISQTSLYQLAHKHRLPIRCRDYSNTLTPKQVTLIRGSLLGDAHAARTSGGKWRLSFRHGPQQYPYLDWKYSTLHNICTTAPKTRKTPDAYGSESRSFVTRTNLDIGLIAESLYHDGVKTVSLEYLHTINSGALAVWIMDDGSLGPHGGILSTHAFSLSESEMIGAWLGNRYNLPCCKLVLDKRCGKWSVRLSTDISHAIAAECFYEIEAVPAMGYKVQWYGKSKICQKNRKS